MQPFVIKGIALEDLNIVLYKDLAGQGAPLSFDGPDQQIIRQSTLQSKLKVNQKVTHLKYRP